MHMYKIPTQLKSEKCRPNRPLLLATLQVRKKKIPIHSLIHNGFLALANELMHCCEVLSFGRKHKHLRRNTRGTTVILQQSNFNSIHIDIYVAIYMNST